MPLSGVGNMKVTNPTITTLTVNWNPADGNVQGYKVIYVPEDGGQEIAVSSCQQMFQKVFKAEFRSSNKKVLEAEYLSGAAVGLPWSSAGRGAPQMDACVLFERSTTAVFVEEDQPSSEESSDVSRSDRLIPSHNHQQAPRC